VSLVEYTIALQVSVGGQSYILYAIDILYIIKSKLGNCSSCILKRGLKDIKFLLDNFASKIVAIQD